MRNSLLHPEILDQLIINVKEDLARERFNKSYRRLTTSEARNINEKINREDLYQRLVGYGMPDITKALY